MIISEIVIREVKSHDGLLALASCVVDDKFFVGSIGIYKKSTESGGGYRITYPTKVLESKDKFGKKTVTKKSQLKLWYPITKEVGDIIEQAIIDEYNNLLVNN